MKKIKILAFAVLALVIFSPPAMAQNRDFSQIYYECGLGGMIFKDNGVAAAVSNICWDWGTTASSSALTTPDACKGGQEKMAAFIHETYDSIETDLASGSGDHLDTLMLLAGITEKVTQDFIIGLREDFAVIVGEASYTDQTRFEKAEALYSLVYQNLEQVS
ncbi:MAG: DUF3015 family protein [Candidatus Omnitrophica bacterium]|nr:DUF3015 family protein [Candidatus Omnitrophota bacterium]